MRLISASLPAAVILAALHAVPAAALPHTFVAPKTGSDVNPCTLALPCQTLAQALTVTDASGAVTFLESGETGKVTLTQGVTIGAEGVSVQIVALAGETAVTINAGANDQVRLTGVNIIGRGVGAIGISVTSLGRLHLRDLAIRGFTAAPARGLSFTPANAGGAASQLLMENVGVSNTNGGNILIRPTGATTVRATLTQVLVNYSSGFGISADSAGGTGGINLLISDSTISMVNTFGIQANSSTTRTSVMVVRSNVTHCAGTGVSASGGNATVVLNGSTTAFNVTGLAFPGGVTRVVSLGNNAINFNTTNGTPVSSPLK